MSPRLAIVVTGLVALCCWLALRAAPPLHVQVGDATATRALYGFYDAEAGDDERFRWSGPDARLLLHGAPRGASLLALRLSGERLVAQGEPELTLASAGRALAAFDLTPGWRTYRVLLPPGALTDAVGTARPLALRTAVSTPGADLDARDYRPLGVPLADVRLAALPNADTGAWPRGLFLAWIAALAGGAAQLLISARSPRATGAFAARRDAALARGTLVSAVIALVGAGLALWAWRDPYGLAWTLPAAPWMLGLGTVVLLGAMLRPGSHFGRPVQPPGSSFGVRWAEVSPREPFVAAVSARRSFGLTLVRRWTDLRGAVLGSAVGNHIGLPLLLVVALGLMHAQLALGLALGLVIAVLVVMAASAGSPILHPSTPPTPWLLLALVFGLALGLRLLRLDELPFGLWRDEARHGLVALRIAEDPTYRPVYVLDERVQLPGLGLYPFALALELFGVQMWTMRLPTALAGALTILPLYAVAARLSGQRMVGLLAALLLAVSSWHISVSRLAFPTVFEPLLSLTAWWLTLISFPTADDRRPTNTNRVLLLGCGALVGVLLGIAAQTYHTGRVMPLATGWLALLLLLRAPGAWRRWLVWMGAAALGAALTLTPLLVYALTRPGDFNSRVGEVFLLSAEALQARAPLAALDANLGRHLLMFTVAGDANGRHHAPLRPMLDILSGLGLLLGLGVLLRHLADWRTRFLLGAIALGLLPGLLSVDAPHGMRSFGALAPVCIVAALGLAELWRITEGGRRGAGGEKRLAVVILLVGLLGLNAGVYFGLMPRDERVFAGFYPVQSWMGAYVAADDAPGRIFVPAGVRDHPSFLLLAAGRPVETFTGGPDVRSSELSAMPAPGDRILLSGYFPAEETAALVAALGPLPAPVAAGPLFPGRSAATFYVIELP